MPGYPLTVISGPDPRMVEKAKELCEDLLVNVKEQYEEFKSRPPRHFSGDRDRYSDRHGGGHSGPHSNYGRQGQGGYNAPATSAAPSASPPASSSTPGSADYAAQYAQYYGGQDPYAMYGGYAA